MTSSIKATSTPVPSMNSGEIQMSPDKRLTMPKGGYQFGRSNSALRPVVPPGQ